MLEGFQNASRVPELRRRLLFTFGMLAGCRVGVAIPTPGIDSAAPERTDTRSGLSDPPNLRPIAFSSLCMYSLIAGLSGCGMRMRFA